MHLKTYILLYYYLTARMIRINLLSFRDSENIIPWTSLQGMVNSKFTSMILVQIMLCTSSAQATSTEHRQTFGY